MAAAAAGGGGRGGGRVKRDDVETVNHRQCSSLIGSSRYAAQRTGTVASLIEPLSHRSVNSLLSPRFSGLRDHCTMYLKMKSCRCLLTPELSGSPSVFVCSITVHCTSLQGALASLIRLLPAEPGSNGPVSR